MQRRMTLLGLLLGVGLAAIASSNQPASQAAVRLVLSEVQPGSMSSDQSCTLVFADRRFHHEKASRQHGRELARKIYEGELSEGEWGALDAILDSREFRALNVPRTVAPLVMSDSHVYTISVAREGKFQNMEFLDNKSRKPYESQLKPLLQWWKSFRGRRMSESNAPPDARCSLDSSHGIFSQ